MRRLWPTEKAPGAVPFDAAERYIAGAGNALLVQTQRHVLESGALELMQRRRIAKTHRIKRGPLRAAIGQQLALCVWAHDNGLVSAFAP